MLVRSALSGHLDRVQREKRTAVEIAWHNARWTSFCKQLEPLGDILREAEGRDEDPDIAWHRMKVWAAAYGQEVVEA